MIERVTNRVDLLAVAPRCRLRVLHGPDSGVEIDIPPAGIVIGGAAPSDVVLGDRAVSRRHCAIKPSAHGFSVTDLGSANGTHLDGVALQKATVSAGAILRVGNTHIQLLPEENRVEIPPSSRVGFGEMVGGSLAMRQGRLAQAEPLFAEQVDAMRRNAAEQPLVARWQESLVDALLLLADAQAARGQLQEARASVEQAHVLAKALFAKDPSNNYWRLSLGRVLWWQAWFATRQGGAAPATAQEAVDVLGQAHATEPRNHHVLSWLIRTRHLQAEAALANGDLRHAREHLVAARTLVEPEWRTAPDEVLRVWLARTRVLQGRIELREGDMAGATSALVEARDLVLDDAATEVPFPRLDVLVRALLLLGQAERAAPHLQRLERAGFVPLHPFPEAEPTVSGYPAGGADAPASAHSTGRAPSSREQTPGSTPTR